MLSKLLVTLRSALVCSFSLLAVASQAQTTINVGPGQPHTTIQSGIDAAINGDTVLVAPGTYSENVDFKGKAIFVTSSGGAALTTISGPNQIAAVLFMRGENRGSVLSNFTITAGGKYNLSRLGGIYISNASPTILNNVITNTMCYGINSQHSSPLIQGNEISYVQAQPYECSFASGAGIWLSFQEGGATPVIAGNTIENNTESGLEDAGGNGGAGIAVWSAGPIIESNIIRNNATGKYFSPAGGGEGGGIFFEGEGAGLVANNLIYGNTSNLDGGGVSFYGFLAGAPNITFINNTIVDNAVVPVTTFSQTVFGGQQLYFSAGQGSVLNFSNNIISGSTTDASITCWTSNASVTYLNNDFYNKVGPAVETVSSGGVCSYPAGTSGNISADPLFTSPAAADYHLQLASPAVDSGNNQALQPVSPYNAPLSTDLDGKPRIQGATNAGCVVDMGAYEYPGTQTACSTTETLVSSLNPSTYGQTVTFTAQLSSSAGIPTGSVKFSDGNTVLGTVGVSGTGGSTFSTSALTVGLHNISAVYQPTGVFSAASASLSQIVNGYTTTTNLTCSPISIPLFNTALLTATVSSTNGTPTGSITFTDNGLMLAQSNLAGGAATATYTGQTVGTHTIVATFIPTGSYAGSFATCSEVVTALPTASVLAVSPATSTFGSPVTLTATVSPVTPPGPSVPTGVVTFYNGTNNVGTATLSNGVATLVLSTLPGGNDTLTCTYGGSSIYATSNCNNVPIVINAPPTTLTLSSSSNPAYALSPVTFTARLTANGQPVPAGIAITLGINGQTTNLITDATGSAASTINTLTPGSYPVSATFPGNNSLLASSASLTELVNSMPTTTLLLVTPNPAYLNQAVTMTAAVATSIPSSPVTNGSVTFLDGATSLGTQPVNASGIATYTTSALAVGTHPITATFNPASNSFVASTSPMVNEVILPSGFTIALSPATIRLTAGANASTAIQLASVGSFAGPLALTYGTLPTHMAASISPATVTLTAAGTGSSTMTLTSLFKASNTMPARPGSRELPTVFVAFTLLLVPIGVARRRNMKRLLGLTVVLLGLQGLTGCTNTWYTLISVSPGTYQIPVTATDLNHNSQTATLTVIVTQ